MKLREQNRHVIRTLVIVFVTRCCMGASAIGAVVTGSATVVSDYDYRGVSQTANDPAVQVGVDYVAGRMHLGVWSSNIEFGESHGFFGAGHTEVAYSASVSGGSESTLGYEIGINYFTYPGWRPNDNYPEVAATVERGAISSSFHYTRNYSDVRPHAAAYYLEGNGHRLLPLWGLDGLAHVGLSWGEYWNIYNGGKYADFSVGVQKAWPSVTLAIQFIGTKGYVSVPRGDPFSGKSRFVLSISLPVSIWKSSAAGPG